LETTPIKKAIAISGFSIKLIFINRLYGIPISIQKTHELAPIPHFRLRGAVDWKISMEKLQEVAEQIFATALDLDPGEREAYLRSVCQNSPEVRARVDKLLEEDDLAGSFLEQPLFDHQPIMAGEMAAQNGDSAKGQAATPPQFLPGDVICERFLVIRFIARGGMGEVYEVEDRQLRGVHVALKTVLSQYAADPLMQERFEREVLNARKVVHLNICPIYDLFNWNRPQGRLTFLTMKLLAGETLSARLARTGPLAEAEALSIIRQVGAGLSAAHEAGILHRDIKAANIILDGSGGTVHACVTDFGLARPSLGDATSLTLNGMAGTPGYMAPELFCGGVPSTGSDVFSFGVVVYQILTGHLPLLSLVHTPANHGSPSIQEFSPRWRKLINGCLEPNPELRFKDIPTALQTLAEAFGKRKEDRSGPRLLTRRRMIALTAGGCVAAAGGAWLERDRLTDWFAPLPAKRFVALLVWPKTSDVQLTPMLNGALTAIKNELARFESVDHDLFVISPEDAGTQLAETDPLKSICDSLGANLILAASALHGSSYFKVLLRLLDPVSGHLLRERTVGATPATMTLLPQKSVKAATALLGLPTKLAASRAPVDPGTHLEAAFAAFQSAESLMKQPNDGGLQPAIEKYRQAVDLDPRYATAYAKLGIAYCRLAAIQHDPGALDLARRNCETSLDLNPNEVESHTAMAAILQLKGDDKGAFKEFSRALALDPSDPITVLWQAQLYAKLNRWQDAERTFQRVLALRPNYWIAYNDLGAAFNSQGKYTEAINQFRAACVAAPGSAMAFSNLGTVYMQLGRFPEAVEYLKKSLSLKPNPLAASNISGALRAQGKPADALPFAQKAVELDPADDWNWLELADCYSSIPGHQASAKGAYQKAAAAAENHLRTDPTDGAFWMQLALYQVKSGSPQEALSLMKKAETLGASDMDSQLTKARVMELLGRRDDALAILKTCFLRGATDFQVASAPDLRSLQRDPRYKKLLEPVMAARN
jgi:tetratricopeptide (TPR) repeat protein/tRNA A-37 threonylcarbamoyl transferase component Bud32